MTDKQKATPEEPRRPFAGMPFGAMMGKMMGRRWQGCDRATQDIMSQMMAMCGVVWDETSEEPVADVNQKA